ncbi:DUF4156 domain-containing protein [Methylomagnum ishizawai]|uniref:DUF4156 domain-containing protein n=1 Tax=Methylomagnum ishizawai TaxID=1760988 RepID=UPI001C335A77|nr:DUF4156 domain-containing protein [Methylomagnum ishizawai]BBL74258.1 hypothetical protein MishRS11D_13560 [Methylomagnum ishizawai]
MGRTRRFGTLAGAVLLGIMAGCAWVDLKPQGEKVRVLSKSEVGRCKPLGQVTANTTATLGFIARGKSVVQEEVYRLARNNAGGMGGDTIVAKGPLLEGEQSFDVYRCINP